MEKTTKFLLPSPNFDGRKKTAPKPRHFLTPSGMTLLPRDKQPPPMYGPRGTTVPAKFLTSDSTTKQKQNETQFCEPCEMELQSMEDFRLHRAQHQRCLVGDCNYRGHPTVMDKHVAALHTTGLFDKFKKLSTPEEIAAWREERRKRYPTVANVQMRQKAQLQRQKRGERLEANKSRFGKREDRIRMKRAERTEHKKQEAQKEPEEHNRNTKNVQRNKRRKKAKRCAQESESTCKSEVKMLKVVVQEETGTVLHGAQMFKGTKSMVDYKHFKVKNVAEGKNALTCLIGMYGSDDDSNCTDDEETENCEENNAKIVDSEAMTQTKENNYTLASIVEEKQSDDYLVCHTNTPTEETSTSRSIDLIAVETTPTQTNYIPEHIHVSTNSSEPSKDNELLANDGTKEPVEKNESSDEAPEEAAIAKTTQLPDRSPRSEPPRKRAKAVEAPKKLQRSIQSGLDYRKSRLRKQNTMLEKLLEPDIRHERNVLLQCVRFVCENNYFGIGQQINKDVKLT